MLFKVIRGCRYQEEETPVKYSRMPICLQSALHALHLCTECFLPSSLVCWCLEESSGTGDIAIGTARWSAK